MTIYLVATILLIYFLVLLIISYFTSQSDSNDSFFVGDRKSPWYVVAFGMIGASLSGITFISIPGSVAKYSQKFGLIPADQFGYMQMVFGYFIGYLAVAFVLLPIYYNMNLTSIYTYLENRFGYWSYKTGSAFFLISRLVGAAIRLLLVSSVLQLILFDDIGIPFEFTVIGSVLLIWVYTNKGGIKTIIWTDTLQTFFMLAAVICTVYLIADYLDFKEKGGFINEINQSGYSKIFFFEDWHNANYFWKHFLGGIFITIGMTGLDQDMMQKNLSCKNLKSAQTNMITFAGVLIIVNLIFLVLGALLFMYFSQTGIGLNVLDVPIPRTDLLFAEIAKNGTLGLGLGVLFLLGLIAAAYSSADSALTSLTTSFSIDFLEIDKKPFESQKKTRKSAHLLMSVVLIFLIIFLRKFSNDSAIWMLIKLAGFTYGPLIGLFFFGILTNRNLIDKCVPIVCSLVPIVIAIIWFLHTNGRIDWFGNYQFGAELIIYNFITSLIALFLISKKS